MFQEGSMEIGQGKGTILETQSLGARKETIIPSKKTNEIKRLRKEQQRFLNIIKRLRQQIRVIKMGKSSERTPGAKHTAT